MSANKNAFGLENSWLIYVIGALTVIEACIFTILHNLMLNDISLGRELTGDIWWIQLQLNVLDRVTFASFGVQGFRLLSGLTLLLGRMKGSIEVSAMFCLFTIIGIIGNIVTGVFLVQNEITRRVAVTSLMIIAMHIVYIVVCLKICSRELGFKKKTSSTSEIAEHRVQVITSPQEPVQLQYASPVADLEQAQHATSVRTPDRIENNFPMAVNEYTPVEHRPRPVCNGTCVCPLQTSSFSHPRYPRLERPPSYEEGDTGPSQAVETKQDIEDPPLKIYI